MAASGWFCQGLEVKQGQICLILGGKTTRKYKDCRLEEDNSRSFHNFANQSTWIMSIKMISLTKSQREKITSIPVLCCCKLLFLWLLRVKMKHQHKPHTELFPNIYQPSRESNQTIDCRSAISRNWCEERVRRGLSKKSDKVTRRHSSVFYCYSWTENNRVLSLA